MKKYLIFLLTTFLAVTMLCSCSHSQFVNITHFTDNFNSVTHTEKIRLSDYFIKENVYSVFLTKAQQQLLLTLSSDESGRIKQVRLALIKTDKNGKIIPVSSDQAEFFTQSSLDILSAFTFFEKEKCEAVLKDILPETADMLSKTGEATTDAEQFHIVYYSNKICSQFSVTNTFLQETETTKKPVSKPIYQETANIRED